MTFNGPPYSSCSSGDSWEDIGFQHPLKSRNVIHIPSPFPHWDQVTRTISLFSYLKCANWRYWLITFLCFFYHSEVLSIVFGWLLPKILCNLFQLFLNFWHPKFLQGHCWVLTGYSAASRVLRSHVCPVPSTVILKVWTLGTVLRPLFPFPIALQSKAHSSYSMHICRVANFVRKE